MGDVITFRPKVLPQAEIKSLPPEIAASIKLAMSSFPFEFISSFSKVTVENLKMAAIRGLLKSFENSNGPGITTVECGNFNCSFENTSTGPHFYLDWVLASSYSKAPRAV
jgi:hypothetical protein